MGSAKTSAAGTETSRNLLLSDEPGPEWLDPGVKRLVDYFLDNPEKRISINKACRLAQMGRRSLYYQFSKYTGLPPIKYFRMVRLSYLREELVCSDRSVTELALKYNFTHLGDFAALYKSVYGELPSETRQRGSRLVAIDVSNSPDGASYDRASSLRMAV